jgi:hypothetical protein
LRYPFAVSRLLPVAETIDSHGCSVILRRVAGPEAREFFLAGAPRGEATDAGGQAEAIYRAILGVLERVIAAGGTTTFLPGSQFLVSIT